MGIRLQNNFKKRFGNRPIKVIYPEKPFIASDKCLQNDKLLDAFKAVLTGILKREPTLKELRGLEDISKNFPPPKDTP